MFRLKPFLAAVAGGAGLVAAAGGSQATSFSFTNGGAPACSEACSATATITPGAGTLTVVLTDTQANPRSAGDLVSSIEITPSGIVGTPTLASQAGTLITVASNTGPYTTSPGPPTHWGVGVSGSNCTGGSSCIGLETAGPFAVGGAPINMIIGPPDAAGNYSNGNSSVVDGHFSPYIDGTGTFVIADLAITAATTIAGVTFDFGTGPDTFQPGVPGMPVPEPGTLSLFGSALAAFVIMRRRKKAD